MGRTVSIKGINDKGERVWESIEIPSDGTPVTTENYYKIVGTWWYPCPLCSREFWTEKGMRIHKTKIHGRGKHA